MYNLNNGEERKFLKDGDTVIMKGYSQNKDVRIGFGQLRNKII